ncbi:hypothetical protein K4F52_010192 [Lecanicillium sp. MT-2017a]|nr:hypothetical protein K4F52_010192 [Lecanicillium sp. MT-2017a]
MPMTKSVQWDRLIRYVSRKDGRIRYGEPIVSHDDDIDQLAATNKLKVRAMEGASALSAAPTGDEDEVKELLGPLTPDEVSVIRCIGLNYKTHIAESGFAVPSYPTLFFKTGHAVADTRTGIPIPKIAQAACDFEGELTVLIGADAKNVSESDALDYVAGYLVGNDISCRDWQLEKEKAGDMQQWCFSKSFDKYAPLGPAIVSPHVLGEAFGLPLRTYVNGSAKQDSNTADLVFGVRKLVSFLSTGQTLKAGSLIMTGTPGGVGVAMKPPQFLADGDEVVVEIKGIGKVRNVMRFE